ncbi:MAG: hypothetical protein U1E23_09340 [Reyranellaceae bacterium]
MSDDHPLVEVVARALDYNGVLDVSDDAIGVSIGWPASDKAALRIDARAVLAAIEAAGWRVVPTKPTEAMVIAGYNMQCSPWRANWNRGGATPELYVARNIWKPMLAAAPKVTP